MKRGPLRVGAAALRPKHPEGVPQPFPKARVHGVQAP